MHLWFIESKKLLLKKCTLVIVAIDAERNRRQPQMKELLFLVFGAHMHVMACRRARDCTVVC